MKEYKVEGKVFSHRQDALDFAHKLLCGRHYDDDDAVNIDIKDGEDFFEPYAILIRNEGRPMLRR